jgi:DNA replication protein DnaC
MTDSHLDHLLDELRLGTIKRYYDSFSLEAIKTNKTMVDYLKALAQEEYNDRMDNRIKRLISQAKFPVVKTLAEFDFKSIPTLNKQMILSLADCHFVSEKQNICLLGQTGTGKTHLATAIAYESCKKKIPTLFFSAAKLVNLFIDARKQYQLTTLQKKLAKAKLIVIDELGYIPFCKEGSEHLFQFFSDMYERSSLIVTTNLEFSDWTSFMGNATMTSALLDRFTHHCEILTLNGESYRFKQRQPIV